VSHHNALGSTGFPDFYRGWHLGGHSDRDAVGQWLAAFAGRGPIETHVSEVYVGADTVWKRKKPVCLAFIDFTRLAERRRCLLRELALNTGPAPGLYRDVVGVVASPDGSLAFTSDANESQAVIDWVLRMARVEEAEFLDRWAIDGRVDEAVLVALGDMVAEMHGGLPPVTGWDSAGAMQRTIVGNVAAARDAGLAESDIGDWAVRAEAACVACAPWLAARPGAGFVRRAHGDLHLGNVCFWQGRWVPLDALEFDEALATIDVGYDLAFLLMDLAYRLGRAAANRVLNRYVARTGDVGLVGGLALFLSMRAMVRAHVRARSGDAAEGGRYLRAALAYLTDGLRPACVLALGGLPGTGKSTLARVLAPLLGPAPGALILRSDAWRKRLHGVLPEQTLPPSAYTPAESERTHQAIRAATVVAAKSGHSVIVDATLVEPDQRATLASACTTAGVAFRGVWLDAPLPVLLARVRARQNWQARDASDATEAVLQQAFARATGRPLGGAQDDGQDWPVVSTA
jgi:aminoglycoside phosphotransferase family enzyme/predicted kinase